MGSPSEERDALRRSLIEERISRADFDRRVADLGSPSLPPAPQPGWSGHTSMPSPAAGAPLPERIGSYLVRGIIGRGGMGVVYRAIHRIPPKAAEQGGEVAVKVPHADLAADQRFHDLFEREAWNGIAMKPHPGIARVFDLVTEGTTLGLVMELVPGRSLSTVIRRETGPLPPARALPLFQEVLAALGFAHEQGVVHRDIKPDNLIVTPDWRVKILDFGVARSTATRDRSFAGRVGTLDYMAPEQYDRTGADRIGPHSDLYALGMTLYEALAGRLPWDDETGEQIVISEKLMGRVPRPDQLEGSPPVPPIPGPFIDVIMKAIALEPADRFQTAAEFSAALSAAFEGVGPLPVEPGPAARPSAPAPRRATEVMAGPPPAVRGARLSDKTVDLSDELEPVPSRPSPILLAVGALGLLLALIGFTAATLGPDDLEVVVESPADPPTQTASQAPQPSPPPITAQPQPSSPDEPDVDAERRVAEREAARRAEAERQRQAEAADNLRRAEEEERGRAEEEARRQAEEEARRRAAEEARRLAAQSSGCTGGQDCQLRAREARSAGKTADAIAMYKRSCNAQWGAGCYGAGMMYLQGQVTGRPEPNQAKTWFGKGCSYGHQPSCSRD